ncbi:MFS transporter [Streptomyces sp. NPDC088789]|uniref:MFS transporter n=1 Tax=Streptomyces sp. NPDC088789 TaxID=3365899 RepID=UPI003800E20C
MTATPATPVAPARAAHRDPNVLRWLGAYTSSMIGDNIYYLALSWAAVRSGTPAQAGLVMALSALPRAVLMLGGGVLADRLGPRRVVIVSDLVRCGAALAVAALLFLGSPGLWPLAVLALVFGAVDAVFVPAVGAMPPRITAPDQLARVQGMRGLATRCASVIGAPLGGLGIALGGAAAAFGAAALLIAVSVPLLMAVRVRRLPETEDGTGGDGGGARGELRAGLRYIRRHPVLAPLMLAIALGDLGFVGPLNVGVALLADERGWGASGLGWVIAGFSVGAGAASLLLTARGRLPYAGRLAAYSLLGGAVAIGTLPYAPGLLAAVGTALAIGLLAGLSGVLCSALLQTHTEPAYLGRVTSVAMLAALGLAPLAMPVAAAAIGVWGTGPVFVVSAAVCALGAAVALAARPLRHAELPR